MDDTKTDLQDWNRVADTYSQMMGTSNDRIYQQFRDVLWDSLGNLSGQAVLDIGCGHGWLSKLMLEANARVWGIDGSEELLNKARQNCPEVEFTQWDLIDGLPETDRKYDRMLAYMVLMDVPDLGKLLQGVRNGLTKGGKFIFTITHPCFYNYKSRRDEATGQLYCGVKDYLPQAKWRIESFGGHWHYHRSLTYYVECLRKSGLALTRLYEPEQIAYDVENTEFHRHIPKFMLVESQPI
jgi:ubiquinone/menaquinone biosynthesis C-methylase UbiE